MMEKREMLLAGGFSSYERTANAGTAEPVVYWGKLCQKFPHLLFQFLHILELPMHRCKPDVRDFIELLELLHHIPPDRRAHDFFLVLPPLFLELREHRAHLFITHRALRARKPDSPLQFLAAVGFPRPVLFNDNERGDFLPFKCREPVLAARAFAAAAHSATIVAHAGIDDRGIGGFATGTVHNRV